MISTFCTEVASTYPGHRNPRERGSTAPRKKKIRLAEKIRRIFEKKKKSPGPRPKAWPPDRTETSRPAG